MDELSKLDAVILCGGLGTRLRPVIGRQQKVLADISGRPFLDILLQALKQQGFRRIILCAGYALADIQSYCDNHTQDLDIVISSEQGPLGTGGAIAQAKKFIRSDPFFVFNGDSFCSIDIYPLLEFHKQNQASASIVLSKCRNAKDYGSVTIDDQRRVTAFNEKNPASANIETLVNAGIYCFNQSVFAAMPEVNRFSLEQDFFTKVVKDAEFSCFGYVTDKEFWDIGTPERYEEIRNKLN